MDYAFSHRISGLKPSAIREIFKYSSDPEVIPLAAGTPAAEALPVDLIRRLTDQVLTETPDAALLYSQTEGHPPFREALKDMLRERWNTGGGDDEILVTTGAQQCMDLSCKVLCNAGDTILCEDPSFIGSLNTFRSYRANLVGVPMEEDGIHLEKLEQALRDNPNTKFLYLIPNFQNPTGITMSLKKRKACYGLALRYGVLILEDNPYGDLQFEGEPLPTIKSMDREGIVLYAGTFSKILSSGIRVGYLLAPGGLIGKLTVAKQCTDVHTSMLCQLLCHRFITQADLDAHLRMLRQTYKRKCSIMLDAAAEFFPASVAFTRPQGGLFVWATLPGDMDGTEFAVACVQNKKVSLVPGAAFSVREGEPSSSFRMNFSTPTDERVEAGTRRVGDLLREMGL